MWLYSWIVGLESYPSAVIFHSTYIQPVTSLSEELSIPNYWQGWREMNFGDCWAAESTLIQDQMPAWGAAHSITD